MRRVAVSADARQDYVLNCMGCHMVDGGGAPPTIPRLKDRVGYYLTIPHGRAYLAQVPGAANSLLDDRQLTAVLNWMVDEFAGASRPRNVRTVCRRRSGAVSQHARRTISMRCAISSATRSRRPIRKPDAGSVASTRVQARHQRRAAFRANDAHHRKLSAELRELIAKVALGGDERSRARHVERGKFLPRERLDRLLDPGSAFLEIGQLAGARTV